MGQPGIAQGERSWYLITSYGDLVVRVHPNMSVGESPTGELSFDPTCAQLNLDIDDDGGLLLKAVDDHELESSGGPRCRKAHLARHRRAEIHLPHNIIRIDTDFVNLAPTDDSAAILTLRPLGDSTKPDFEQPPQGFPEEPVDTGIEARPPQRATSRSAPRGDDSAPDGPPLEPMHGIPLPLRKPAPEPDGQSVSDRPADLRTEQSEQPEPIRPPEQIQPIEQVQQPEQIQPIEQIQQPEQTQPIERVDQIDTRRQRILSPLIAGLIGLAAISFALLLYLALREDRLPAPPPATVEVGPAPPAEPAAAPSAVQTPSPPQPLPASEGPPAAEPEGRDQVADRQIEPLPEPEPAANPDIEQLELPLAERRSIPPVPPAEPTVRQTPGGAETAAAPTTIDSPPDAAVTEEPEQIDTEPDTAVAAESEAVESRAVTPVVAKAEEVSERPQNTEQARRRALRAADVALEQGRLTTPPEASAYTLYNRVLDLDPESPEARSGLQSVRQALINRALAQLASDALDDARKTLQAAADIDANPMLVGDLLREVDYRQQMIDAQEGDRRSP